MALSRDRYPIPARTHRTEELIRRSRFITTVGRASEPEDAHRFIDAVSGEFIDATHHCWAFVAGPPGSTTRIGLSDDGEPQGTAGRPILNALLHSGVGEIAAVVTRFYGGVKLGRGGLGRAYAGGVQSALESLPRAERVSRRTLSISVDYPVVDGVLRLLEDVGAIRLEEEFGARVELRVGVPLDRLADLERGVADLTGGAGTVRTERAHPD